MRLANQVLIPKEEVLEPSYRCLSCEQLVYKGVRIGGEEKFCIDCYRQYKWVQFYKENLNPCDWGCIYNLTIEVFSDNGFTNTLR